MAKNTLKFWTMRRDREIRVLLLLCAVVLVCIGLYFSHDIFAPVSFAIFTIAIAWPLQRALQAKIPKLLALVVTIAVTLFVIVALAFTVVWGLSHVVEWLVNNNDRFQALYVQATEWLDEHGISITSLVADSYNPSWMIGAAREIGGRGYRLISFIVIAFAFIVLGLLEVDVTRRNIERLKNPELRRSLLSASEDIADKFQKYMVVRTIMSIITGLIVWSFALAAGIELATAWGIIAFVFNYIPFIGPLIATLFPTLFALVQTGSWELSLAVFACLNFIQFFTGSYLEPRMAGATLSISPFVVLFAVFFWSFLWGISGAFIGAPIVIAILAICDRHESTHWIALLLSGHDKEADPK